MFIGIIFCLLFLKAFCPPSVLEKISMMTTPALVKAGFVLLKDQEVGARATCFPRLSSSHALFASYECARLSAPI